MLFLKLYAFLSFIFVTRWLVMLFPWNLLNPIIFRFVADELLRTMSSNGINDPRRPDRVKRYIPPPSDAPMDDATPDYM